MDRDDWEGDDCEADHWEAYDPSDSHWELDDSSRFDLNPATSSYKTRFRAKQFSAEFEEEIERKKEERKRKEKKDRIWRRVRLVLIFCFLVYIIFIAIERLIGIPDLVYALAGILAICGQIMWYLYGLLFFACVTNLPLAGFVRFVWWPLWLGRHKKDEWDAEAERKKEKAYIVCSGISWPISILLFYLYFWEDNEELVLDIIGVFFCLGVVVGVVAVIRRWVSHRQKAVS